jgi:competence protein ComFC
MGKGIIKNIRFIYDCVLQVIYSEDEKCIICKDDLYEKDYICNKCEKTLKFCKDSFYIQKDEKKFKCYSVSYYSGIMMELILNLKYKSDFMAGELISNYMLEMISKNQMQFDYIAYVPMTKSSLKKRGYNQGEYLAKKISKNIDIPLIHCLNKVMTTKDQIGLSGNERWENIQGSIKFLHKYNIKNKKILLVDDVITTGATTFSCAEELIKNGAEKITVLTGAKSNV